MRVEDEAGSAARQNIKDGGVIDGRNPGGVAVCFNVPSEVRVEYFEVRYVVSIFQPLGALHIIRRERPGGPEFAARRGTPAPGHTVRVRQILWLWVNSRFGEITNSG